MFSSSDSKDWILEIVSPREAKYQHQDHSARSHAYRRLYAGILLCYRLL
jgi:hypothetical protein